MPGSSPTFTTIRSEGALLPPSLLARIQAGDATLPGLTSEAYHLPGRMKLNEAASRAWTALQGAWASFQDARSRLPDDEPGTTITRERWLLPLFQELGYGRLEASPAVEIDGKSYALSHGYKHAPLHLLGCGVDLDRRSRGVAGAATGTPHSLVQEFLNRRDDNLWGVVTNGLTLRMLRDNLALTRQAYLEFDLEAMLDGEVYSDFVLLYLLLHQSRLEAPDPTACLLEAWSREAADTGARALENLANGVRKAIEALGRGFLAHRANGDLRTALRDGSLGTQDYYRELLRLVYRLLFLFVAEDRDALHPPDASDAVKDRYRYYSTRRLREVADGVRGGRHPDAYEALKTVFRALAREGAPALGLPALGGFLFSDAAAPNVMRAGLGNAYLYQAVRALAFTRVDGVRRPVDYRNLGSEELGSVYEGLLELHPEIDTSAGTFALGSAAGNERKTTGSFYTPTSLITLLLDSALEPVLHERVHGKPRDEAEHALLSMRVVDPACGSGHFLVAAGQRMAKRLATIRTGDEEPAPEDVRTAVRDVVGRCLYGVDVNPMSAELCKVALWMEALEPGKPLSFLEHRIQIGDSLLGATPELIADGIPDDAYKPIEGDVKKLAAAVRKKNREERGGQGDLFVATEPLIDPDVARTFASIEAMPSDDVHELRAKEAALAKVRADDRHARARRVADAWCAAFVWPLTPDAPPPVTTAAVRALQEGRAIEPERQAQIDALRDRYGFFHWHIAFPEVLRGAGQGFDVVLGNPPWERVKLQEVEWFASRVPEIADAPNAAARRRLIEQLEQDDPALYAAFLAARRRAEGVSHFVRTSGRFPLTGRGDVNTYQLFAEVGRDLLAPTGRSGVIVPSGIATDATTQYFFQSLVEHGSLVSLYDFENRKAIFPGVHRSYKFSLLTLSGLGRRIPEAEFAFFLQDASDLRDSEVRFTLSPEDIELINPNTKTCPIFRTRRDAEITKDIYRRVPILINEATGENPWGITFSTMFHMSNDSNLFRTREQLESAGLTLDGNRFVGDDAEYLPLYEAKMIHHYDHRFATYDENGAIRDVSDEEHADPMFAPRPRYWVERNEVEKKLQKRDRDGNITWAWEQPWLLGFRNITNPTNERTAVFSLAPRVAVGHSMPFVFVENAHADDALVLQALASSLPFDFTARQSLGGTNLTFFIVKQLPVLTPDAFDEAERAFLRSRLQELVATDHTLAAAVTPDGRASRWDEKRRFEIRAELDAFFFHKYGLDRDDAAYIMDTFPIVKRHDEELHGRYRTKDAVLAAYDAIARAQATGEPLPCLVDPPPRAPSTLHDTPTTTEANE